MLKLKVYLFIHIKIGPVFMVSSGFPLNVEIEGSSFFPHFVSLMYGSMETAPSILRVHDNL